MRFETLARDKREMSEMSESLKCDFFSSLLADQIWILMRFRFDRIVSLLALGLLTSYQRRLKSVVALKELQRRGVIETWGTTKRKSQTIRHDYQMLRRVRAYGIVSFPRVPYLWVFSTWLSFFSVFVWPTRMDWYPRRFRLLLCIFFFLYFLVWRVLQT